MPGPSAIHAAFDLAAWLSGWLTTRLVARLDLVPATGRTIASDPGYFSALGAGALAGAYVFGSANLSLEGMWQWGHSIAGALAGAIVAVEIYKRWHGIRGSTGMGLAAPLAVGIAVGRLGCFFAGLPDNTYGIPTSLPWGVDFGDGIPRHPVQLYESFSMLLFAVVWFAAALTRRRSVIRQGFYLFVFWYALQRFAWEFLKPYPKIAGPFNIFHVLCLAMLAYSVFMMRSHFDAARASAPALHLPRPDDVTVRDLSAADPGQDRH